MPTTPGRILVVDDDKAMLKLVAAVLKATGYEATTAADGRSALAMLRGASFDVVVADLHMPGLPGIDVVRAVREAGGRTLAVVITGDARFETATECLRAGAFDIVPKPLDAALLISVLKRAVAEARRPDREGGPDAKLGQIAVGLGRRLAGPLDAARAHVRAAAGLTADDPAGARDRLDAAEAALHQLQLLVSDLGDLLRRRTSEVDLGHVIESAVRLSDGALPPTRIDSGVVLRGNPGQLALLMLHAGLLARAHLASPGDWSVKASGSGEDVIVRVSASGAPSATGATDRAHTQLLDLSSACEAAVEVETSRAGAVVILRMRGRVEEAVPLED